MRVLRILTAGLICSATCVAGEPVKLNSVFNSSEVSFVKQPGNSTVTGTASIKLADGTIKNCAGFKVELLPIAAYAKERIVRTYGNDQQGQILLEQHPPKFAPDVPEYHDMLIMGACDERGEFRFSNVPTGDYFVMAFIIWENVSGPMPRKTGGAAMKRIHVAAGSEVEAHLGGGAAAATSAIPVRGDGAHPIPVAPGFEFLNKPATEVTRDHALWYYWHQHQQLLDELRDETWAPRMEEIIRSGVRDSLAASGLGARRIELLVVECRTSACEVQGIGNTTDNRKWGTGLHNILLELEPKIDDIRMLTIPRDDERENYLVHLKRPSP